MKRFNLPLLAMPLVLAACSDPSPEPDASATPSMAPIVSESEALAPPVAPGASASASSLAETSFPMAMRGRWGMNAADCDPARADNKGLMTVGPNSVKFYESIGEIGVVADRSESVLRAVFDYEGEGMEWKRDARYELSDGGKTLILTEYGDDAPQGPRRYSQCK
ncbi:hypothetical protein HGI47_17005 [Novosphingobium sp. ERN07]|uniref:hypothetical protein n=1 Tax=Novosphingobium sp. ERN07 TaxID=2726187 RepID=UPI001456CC3F|nr:hypothetical protein [Novosphingobium sp. ERN07]NLR72578.1 hypothetical protein [Novosphingobium sp. ERN07]